MKASLVSYRGFMLLHLLVRDVFKHGDVGQLTPLLDVLCQALAVRWWKSDNLKCEYVECWRKESSQNEENPNQIPKIGAFEQRSSGQGSSALFVASSWSFSFCHVCSATGDITRHPAIPPLVTVA